MLNFATLGKYFPDLFTDVEIGIDMALSLIIEAVNQEVKILQIDK